MADPAAAGGRTKWASGAGRLLEQELGDRAQNHATELDSVCHAPSSNGAECCTSRRVTVARSEVAAVNGRTEPGYRGRLVAAGRKRTAAGGQDHRTNDENEVPQGEWPHKVASAAREPVPRSSQTLSRAGVL
jgi:hypothetical protein